MPTTIDGNMAVSVGSVSVGSVSIDPGTNLIGKVQIQDDSTAILANVDPDGAVSVAAKIANNVRTQGAVAMGGLATLLVAANAVRKSAVFTNKSTNPAEIVYLGGNGAIAVGAGIPVAPGETYEDLETGTAWWGIAASGTPSVAVYETDTI